MNRALVTGATGMLGSHLVELLLAEETAVRALVRRPERAAWLARKGVELVEGDLLEAATVERAARGCHEIYHAAAAIGAHADLDHFRRGNVGGTRTVVDAAASAGARLVFVSSTAVFGAARFRDAPTDEEVPLPELPDHDAYGRSKQEAEGLVLRAHCRGRIHATVVRPPVMYGLRDRQFVPRMAAALRWGVFPLVDGGRAVLTLVHGDAVARGMILASRHPEAGGRVFHLTEDFPVTVAEMVRLAGEGLGRRIRTPRIPPALGRAGFAALGSALRLAGREDLARHAPGTLSMLTRDNPFACRRAREVLGWTPVIRPETGIPAAFRHWREHGGGAS